MLTAITGIITLLSSGAGGGILGGIFGLFKSKQERVERLELAKLDLMRDKLDYQDQKDERAHQLVLLEKGADLELKKIETETEAEVELANQAALKSAQSKEFKLNTSTWMDNYRASVRPTLAYLFTSLFGALLLWAFNEFSAELSPSDGKELLLALFGTLTFLVTSMGTFYYVSRRNAAPKL